MSEDTAGSIPWILLLINSLLTVLSGLFSGSEVAFFSLRESEWKIFRWKMRRLRAENHAEFWARLLQQNPALFITFILVGNNLVNIVLILLFFRLWSLWIPEWAKHLGWQEEVLMVLLNGLGTTTWLLFFGEILPKALAIHRRIQWVMLSAVPLRMIWILLYPLTRAAYFLFSYIRISRKAPPRREFEEILMHMERTGTFTAREGEIFRRLFHIRNLEVRKIMLPRIEMPSISRDTEPYQVLEYLRRHPYSHLPVRKNPSTEDVVGILRSKELVLAYLRGEDLTGWHERFVRPPLFVPEYMNVLDLLELFHEKREVIAIVIDEYGSVAGMVTLEDVLEEIVGEIYEEHESVPTIQQISDTVWEVPGTLPLHDLQARLRLPDEYFQDLQEEVDTVAGLILHFTHLVPTPGTRIHYRDLTFEVVRRTPQRILRVRVTRSPNLSASSPKNEESSSMRYTGNSQES